MERTNEELRRWMAFAREVLTTAPLGDCNVQRMRVAALAMDYGLGKEPVERVAPPTLPEVVARVGALEDVVASLSARTDEIDGLLSPPTASARDDGQGGT